MLLFCCFLALMSFAAGMAACGLLCRKCNKRCPSCGFDANCDKPMCSEAKVNGPEKCPDESTLELPFFDDLSMEPPTKPTKRKRGKRKGK